MKVFFILQFFLAAICFQQTSCAHPETPMVKWKGMNDANDIVFFFKKDITYEQKQDFANNVLYKSRTDRRGQTLADGAIDVMVGNNFGDYEGGVVNFSESATNEQREKLVKAIKESPAIYKVYEHTAPNKIKDL